jgi:hypothetical protein
METVRNPYLEQKAELLRKCKGNETPEITKQIEMLDEQSKNFVQEKIAELTQKGRELRETKDEIATQIRGKDAKKVVHARYKEAIQAYRETLALLKEWVVLKKEMRKIMYSKK